jgi:hypothetical protein
MVMLHKLDNTQYGSIAVAEDKARSALYFRRPSKVFEELVAQGGMKHASARAARRLPARGRHSPHAGWQDRPYRTASGCSGLAGLPHPPACQG